jgi:DNA primase
VSRYTADSKERVREAVDMIAVVSERTELRRAGPDEYVGRCPFHDERTPSFGIDPHKKVYHCFGCQASGDVFRFVMETEGLDFAGALESLARRSGVELETEAENPRAAEQRKRRERLHALLGRAAEYYARVLWESREAAGAREYLLGRGLTEETLRAFGVGYAPSAWDKMLLGSRRAGFTEEELLATGLAQRSSSQPGRVFDRFRERIMFPSSDARGRVVGFGARAMRDNQRPKYLNTSEGEIYKKRAQLFGIHVARPQASRAGRVVLVEGYTDVLALHQAGLRNAVGIMGTALTEEQLGELERVAKVLELCLDSDRAGQDAMLRAATVAGGRSLELRVVALPDGMDPAELIEREGADALRARVSQSVPFVAFQVDRILAGAEAGSAEGRDRAIAQLRPLLHPDKLPPSELRDEIVRRVASRLDLSHSRLSDMLAGGANGAAGAPARPTTSDRGGAGGGGAGPRIEPLDTAERAERGFLALCVALPEAGSAALASIDVEALIRSDRYRGAARHLAGHAATPLADLPAEDDDLAHTIADLVSRAGRAGHVSVDRLDHARLVLERMRIEREIRLARIEGRPGIGELARRREQVMAEIHKVVGKLESTV